jgi:flagellar P-ring protein precursor FlgI
MSSRSSFLVIKLALSLLVCFVALAPRSARAERLRDMCEVLGARDNQLVGYGVVTGLNGTGDDASAPFAAQSLRSLLRRLGVQVDNKQVRLRNVAAVVVTATIPPFYRSGSKLDITISSIGNARSLQGGVLLQTPLRGADRKTYAVGQGPLLLGGMSAGGAGGSVTENHTTTARIPSGALVEREIPTQFIMGNKVTLVLRAPDFQNAQRVAEAVNQSLGRGAARAIDAGSIEVFSPASYRDRPVELVAKLNELEMTPVTSARIVVNERTGTIVAGGDVRLSPVAIAQGGITISIKETAEVSQPGPLSNGKTEVTKKTDVDVVEKTPAPALTYLKGAASLADVAQALSTFGVTPRELASILQALKAAGALSAEVVVQ